MQGSTRSPTDSWSVVREISVIQTRHLRYFAKIVEAGSFSRAAALLYVAQPALSSQMAELEEELGVQLLQRSSRGVRTTPEGELLYEQAVAFLHRFDKVAEKVGSAGPDIKGVVHLGVTEALAHALAGPFIKRCKSALPNVILKVISDESHALRMKVLQQSLDLALVFEEDELPGLARKHMFQQQLFLLHADEAHRNTPSLTHAEIARWPLVAPDNGWRHRIDRRFEADGVKPNIVAEAHDLGSLIAAIGAGVGAGIMPVGDLSNIAGADGLIATPIADAYYVGSIIWAQDAKPTRAVEGVREQFIPFIEEHIEKKRPAGLERVEKAIFPVR